MIVSNKIAKSLLIFSLLNSTNLLIAESLAQSCFRKYGNEDARTYYQQKTKEFLNNFGLNADKFAVKKLKPEFALNGRADSSVGIWLNEKSLNKTTEGSRLFTIAHETAHCAQKYSLKRSLAQIIPGIPLACAAYYLCARLKKSTRLALASFTWLTSCFTLGKYVEHKTKLWLEKDADLRAARMLCEHGYAWAVKDEIQSLEYNLQKKGDGEHPTFKQQHAYLKKLLEKWKQTNPSTGYIKL